MIIAIHDKKGSFSDRWIAYCLQNSIKYKLVNCFDSNIVEQLEDCEIVMWHHSQGHPREIIIAKQILFSLQKAGKIVFPDFYTNWHFDDKLGQKYLFEAIGVPLVPSYAFYDKDQALKWVEETEFPKVFKLRGGAGSQNVQLIKTKKKAKKIISKAFGKGFKQYNSLMNLKERYRLFRLGKTGLWDLTKGIIRIIYEPQYSRVMGRECGYVYFQDYIKNNKYDIRVIVVEKKAFAIKRIVRESDFRASGSGNIEYLKHNFDEATISVAFEVYNKMNAQCAAFDFVYEDYIPKLVEVSYAFVKEVYDPCVGYWDENLNWTEGPFDPYGWMVDSVVKEYDKKIYSLV